MTTDQLDGQRSPDWPEDSREGSVSFAQLLDVLWRHRLLIGVVTTFCTVFAAIAAIVQSPRYTASTTFVPETRVQSQLPSGLASLAGQLGVSTGEGSLSPQFYVELARSREILVGVMRERYPSGHGGGGQQATLLDILDVSGRSESEREQKGVEALRGKIVVSHDQATSIITLSAEMRSGELAAGVANRIVQHLNRFNLERRQSQARERRRFLDSRVVEGERALRATEASVRDFLKRNRRFEAPDLQFEHDGLLRQVSVAQELYLTLRREAERARIEEVNDAPVLTTIDSATVPLTRSWPKRKLMVILGFFFGATAALFLAFGIEGAAGVLGRERLSGLLDDLTGWGRRWLPGGRGRGR